MITFCSSSHSALQQCCLVHNPGASSQMLKKRQKANNPMRLRDNGQRHQPLVIHIIIRKCLRKIDRETMTRTEVCCCFFYLNSNRTGAEWSHLLQLPCKWSFPGCLPQKYTTKHKRSISWLDLPATLNAMWWIKPICRDIPACLLYTKTIQYLKNVWKERCVFQMAFEFTKKSKKAQMHRSTKTPSFQRQLKRLVQGTRGTWEKSSIHLLRVFVLRLRCAFRVVWTTEQRPTAQQKYNPVNVWNPKASRPEQTSRVR